MFPSLVVTVAPEVAREEPYNMSCDAYSFAILFWQMLALETPFALYGIADIKARVHHGDFRPKVDPSWSLPIQLLLKRSWSSNWKERYTFENITKILRKEVVRIRSGDDTGLEHNTRRSTFVFRGNGGIGSEEVARANKNFLLSIQKAKAAVVVNGNDDDDDLAC